MPTARRRCATCCAPNSRIDLEAPATRQCVACLSYVYNHHERELAERLTTLYHAHHDLTISSMHAHLDHDHCLETAILRGATVAVARFADEVCAERGVHHGKLNLIGVELHEPHAPHATRKSRSRAAPHVHLKPATLIQRRASHLASGV